MTLALLLSGQGGQHPGMFDLTAGQAGAQAVFEAAKPLLGGADPREVARAGGEALHGNRTGQILCCVAALAAWSVVSPAVAERSIVAGYSIGDLAAWGVAGRLSPEDVLRLAAARAEAMDAASGEGWGLAGIRGIRLDTLAAMAERHGCALAIRNAPDSGVVGGPDAVLPDLCTEAIRAGAQRAVVLAVRTPSHTRFLESASDRFRAELGRAELRSPPAGAPRLLSGLDGDAVFRAEAGLDKLACQISRTIDWAACLEACREYGADRVLELGPGRALVTMARDALPGAKAHALEDFHSIDGLLGWVRSGP